MADLMAELSDRVAVKYAELEANKEVNSDDKKAAMQVELLAAVTDMFDKMVEGMTDEVRPEIMATREKFIAGMIETIKAEAKEEGKDM